MSHKFTLITSAALIALLGAATSASAQITDEIIVTATKKSESIQDIPVSVTAYTGESLRKLGLENSVSLAAQTPGLNVGTPVGEGNNPSFTLRGVGLNDFNDNNEGPIAIYTDEVYNAALPALTFQLFDIERVEVLRGPQGTLYGRNATGGLLNFISKTGGDEFEADIRAQYGRFNAIEVEGGVGGPIGDTDAAHFRLAGKISESDGYVENRIGEDSNENGSLALRGIVDFEIEERGSMVFKVDYSDADTRSPFYQHTSLGGFPTGSVLEPDGPRISADRFRYEDTDGDNFAGDYNGDENRLKINSIGASVNFGWDFGSVQLTNIAAVRETEKEFLEDTDVGPFNGITAGFNSEISQFSNEFRLSGDTGALGWVAGIYYIDTQVVGDLGLEINDRGPGFAQFLDSLAEVGDPAGLPLGAVLGSQGLSFADFGEEDEVRFLTYDVDYTQNTESISLFANVDYALTENLELVVGGRYSDESRDIEYVNAYGDGPIGGGTFQSFLRDFVEVPNYFDFRSGASVLNFNELVGNGVVQFDEVGDLNKIDEDNFSGTIGLNYTLDDGTLLYAKIAQGFKSGGFNAGYIDFSDGVTPNDIPYGAETVTSYEGGVKWTSPAGNVRANVGAFYYDYSDYQALTFSGLTQFIQNSDATFYGAEAELGATLSEGFTVQLGASYVDTSVDQVETRGVGISNDVNTVIAPEFTANGVARYETPMGDGMANIQLSFNHQGSHFFDLPNTNEEDAYTLFDGRVGYAFGADEGLEVYLYGKNLADTEYRVYSFNFADAAGFQQEFYGRPREYGLGFIGRF